MGPESPIGSQTPTGEHPNLVKCSSMPVLCNRHIFSLTLSPFVIFHNILLLASKVPT